MRKPNKILFYYLSAFDFTGGIEKFNRCFIKALDELSGVQFDSASIVSVYDSKSDRRYITNSSFVGFEKNKSRSVLHVITQGLRYNTVIIGHINLSLAGFFVKLLNPNCRLIIVAHGIEVWKKLPFIKKWALRKSDVVLAVSTYTKNQLVLRHRISPEKIKLFPNTIDPFFSIPAEFSKPEYLLRRYSLKKEQPVIFTLSRLASSEKYKGYDKVIEALPHVLKFYPDTKYILAGKCDAEEKQRVEELITYYGLKNNVVFAGYIDENEVTDHYCLADVFIMPSRKEGFGIVFLEALLCGANVIGGNQDGTVDALRNGAFGLLINPNKVNEIASSIISLLNKKNSDQLKIQQQVIAKYGFDTYKQRLADIFKY